MTRPELSDDAMLARLIDRSRLLIALAEDMPVETKLETQPLLKQLEQLLATDPLGRDLARIHGTHDRLSDELADFPDLAALLEAMRTFLPPLA